MKIEFNSIGTIHTPFKTREGMPIQPSAAKQVEGHIEVFSQYTDCLDDLAGFSHIYVLFHLHKSGAYRSKIVPFLDDCERGVFSTRSPSRPNAIGLSLVELTSVEGNILKIKNVDIIDGSPLIDIKPYVPIFEDPEDVRTGWLEGKKEEMTKIKSDSRFS